jgi:hypothetical protein
MRTLIKPAVAVAGVALVVVAAALAAGAGQGGRRQVGARAAATLPVSLPRMPPSAPSELAPDLERAQQIIDTASSPPGAVDGAGRFEQRATVELSRGSAHARRATLALLSGSAAATMSADLAAAGALSRLVTPVRKLPRWRIVAPPPPGTLLGYYHEAQARYAVRWQDLAAVELIETRFGRVHAASSAGALGPMQFLPSTWAEYGRGSIYDQRDAILAAARFLAANGAPRSIAGALYHYNPSSDYVESVLDYAGEMREDPRAYFGYYAWQVVYAHAGGPVILPVGYPRVRPVAIR